MWAERVHLDTVGLGSSSLTAQARVHARGGAEAIPLAATHAKAGRRRPGASVGARRGGGGRSSLAAPPVGTLLISSCGKFVMLFFLAFVFFWQNAKLKLLNDAILFHHKIFLEKNISYSDSVLIFCMLMMRLAHCLVGDIWKLGLPVGYWTRRVIGGCM